MNKQVVAGPGTVRVGRFVGRLGVVSLPAVEAGLDLDQRVVRRHVAKLEAAGWLGRAPWVWGEGSVAWLTGAGIEGAELGGVRAVKSPPSPTTIAHAFSLGGPQHALSAGGGCGGRRGSSRPTASAGPSPRVASAATPSSARPRRLARSLEGTWRRDRRERRTTRGPPEDDARRVARRDLVGALPRRALRLLKPIRRPLDRPPGQEGWLTGSTFMAVVQTTPEQIAAVSPAAPTKSPAVETPTPSDETSSADHEPIHAERVSVPSPPEPPQLTVPVSAPAPEPETAEAAAQREQLIRELVGIDEEKPRRPWRRR